MKYLIIPVIIVLALLGACKKNSDSAVPDTHGNFMFVNAVPDPAAVFNVKLDTINFASNVTYKTSTGYKSYRAQKYNLIITSASQPSNILYNGEIFLRNNRYYSAFLGADSTKRLLSLIVTEDDMTSLGPDKAKFRVIDFSEGFKANRTPLGIDILDILWRDTARVFRGLTFPAQTYFAPLRADSNQVHTINFTYVDSSKLVLKSMKLPTQAGKVYTLITTGYPLDPARMEVLTIQHN
ncbi:DUF4397 domain-containing protein [Chitinophaga sp. 22321]|uniref:DUF4397 domain-containing protein n=1 Tax=Chitinophaga hostae TaxID=2831022 RepID=A0ABS5IUN3_9BACT|nr:DUF4397 domain-containing protein [Chitinophaga hostae]MBS0026675.1 DUF4397 domain-containing protein [Chitinophaga hostae]